MFMHGQRVKKGNFCRRCGIDFDEVCFKIYGSKWMKCQFRIVWKIIIFPPNDSLQKNEQSLLKFVDKRCQNDN